MKAGKLLSTTIKIKLAVFVKFFTKFIVKGGFINMYYPNLFKEGKIGNLTLKNRVGYSSLGDAVRDGFEKANLLESILTNSREKELSQKV